MIRNIPTVGSVMRDSQHSVVTTD